MAKLSQDVLGAVPEKQFSLEDIQFVLSDALVLLACKEIKISSAAASAAQQGGTAPAIGLGGGGRCDAGALGLLDLLLAAQPVFAVLARYSHPFGSTPQAPGRSSHPVHTLEDPRSHAACMIRRERRVRCRDAV